MAVNCSISLCDERIFGTLYLQHPLCYAVVLLKNSSTTLNFAWHMQHTLIQTVILECINKSTNNLYHTMTVLLEYIDRSLQFFITA